MKNELFAALGDRFARLAPALFFCTGLSLPALAQARPIDVFPAVVTTSPKGPLPQGVKVLARVPLQGTPITRMYTQREYRHTYLYIEHGQQSLTTVDITKNRNPRIVGHRPAIVEPVRYEELSEGGTMEIWPRNVSAGIDSLVGRGALSVLDNGDPDDAKLLQAFGPESTNLVDRDNRVVYFASPSQLLIVQDNRYTPLDFTNYY